MHEASSGENLEALSAAPPPESPRSPNTLFQHGTPIAVKFHQAGKFLHDWDMPLGFPQTRGDHLPGRHSHPNSSFARKNAIIPRLEPISLVCTILVKRMKRLRLAAGPKRIQEKSNPN
jgi:hypothetical protein